MNYGVSVHEIIADVMDSKRYLTLEAYVDEYLLAERDIMTEATTTADKMVDLSVDSGYDNESQYLEDDEEVNALLDSHITDDIADEEDIFQDTIEELNDDEDMIEDIEDVIDGYDDLQSLVDDDEIDSLIDGTHEYNY